MTQCYKWHPVPVPRKFTSFKVSLFIEPLISGNFYANKIHISNKQLQYRWKYWATVMIKTLKNVNTKISPQDFQYWNLIQVKLIQGLSFLPSLQPIHQNLNLPLTSNPKSINVQIHRIIYMQYTVKSSQQKLFWWRSCFLLNYQSISPQNLN